ncbi:hypothetical protein [Hymenobacter properus]|uniref:STAS/SEC14 domain-containing protein n=1 Tax=Hymenobacter properus TaxID=2791026 RepID=A0A931BCK0_9BACT|nr:hypothetical protein [Hymenobacter properus]MBF9140794.1 hypothetical protein [Hymenobacter properus]MBR7719603.1 hypothetical protein [Microvirga sp. SRT04]
MALGKLRVHFRNAAGQVLEQPTGRYIIIRYTNGPRRFADLQTLLGHGKQLLALRQWHKVVGDHRRMTPFTPAESAWVTDCWLSMPRTRMREFFGAVLLPADVLGRIPTEQAEGEAIANALTYRLFAEESEAAAWLEQLP